MVFLALLIYLSHAKSHAFVYAIFSEVLPASCQRSIFTLAVSMLAFAGKVCHITELSDLLRCILSSKVSSGAENNKILCPFHTKILHALSPLMVFSCSQLSYTSFCFCNI